MSKEERAAYFNEAERLSALHKQKYPNWSNQVNYVSSAMSLTHYCIGSEEQSQNKFVFCGGFGFLG